MTHRRNRGKSPHHDQRNVNETGMIHPREPEAADLWGRGAISESGVPVDSDSAFNCSAVYAAVNIISGVIGTLPIKVISELRRNRKLSREIDWNSREARCLSVQPNAYRTPSTHFTTAQAHVLMQGNTYTSIERTGGGELNALWLIAPNICRPVFDRGNDMRYEIDVANGPKRYEKVEDMIHVPGMGYDGIQGYSVIDKARESIGLTLAAEKHGNKTFANSAVPKGVLSTQQTLNDPIIKRISRQWGKRHRGLDNVARIAILEAGLEYKDVGMTHQEIEFLQTRKFQINEIARWFNLPPHMLKDLEKSSFSNITQQSEEFIIYSILPWLVRYEQEINRKIFLPTWSANERRYCKFDFSIYLRPNMLDRFKAYQLAIMSGWMNRDEVRFLEELNEMPNGEGAIFLTPLNMGPVGALQNGQQELVN